MSGLANVDRPIVAQRQRPWRPWLLAGAVLVAVPAVAGVFYYSPLRAGALTCPPGAVTVPAPETEDGVAGRERCLLQAGDVHDVRVEAELRNEGPLPIAVTGLALDPVLAEVLRVRELRLVDGGGDAPFAAFTLGPGATRRLAIEATLTECQDRQADRLLTMTDLPVRTRFLGVTKTAAVPIENELSVLVEPCG